MIKNAIGLVRLALRDFSNRNNPTDPTPDYDRAAVTYDEYYTSRLGVHAASLVRAHMPEPGMNVVDLPCGTGCHAVALAQAVGASGSVKAIDLSPGMLEQCTTKASSQGLENIQTVLADGTVWLEARKPDEFDVIYCLWGLCYLDWNRFFAAAHRALAPGGKLVVIENRKDSLQEVSNMYRQVLTENPLALIRKVELQLPSSSKAIAEAAHRVDFRTLEAKDEELALDMKSGTDLLQYLNRGGVSSGFVNAIDPKQYPALERSAIELFDQRKVAGRPIPVRHRFSIYVGCKTP